PLVGGALIWWSRRRALTHEVMLRALEFDGDHIDKRTGRLGRIDQQLSQKIRAEKVFVERRKRHVVAQLPSGADHADTAHASNRNAADDDAFQRTVEQKQIEAVVARRRRAMEIDGRRRRPHADDRVAVARDPRADLLEKRDLDVGQRTIAGGTDIQEQVAAPRYDVGEIARQQVWRFVVGVLRPPTPGVIHGQAQLPDAPWRLGWEELLGGVVVALAW